MNYKFTVKQARAYRGMTVSEMAEKIGLSSASYHRQESNPQNISMELASKISTVLNIPADDLIFLPSVSL